MTNDGQQPLALILDSEQDAGNRRVLHIIYLGMGKTQEQLKELPDPVCFHQAIISVSIHSSPFQGYGITILPIPGKKRDQEHNKRIPIYQ